MNKNDKGFEKREDKEVQDTTRKRSGSNSRRNGSNKRQDRSSTTKITRTPYDDIQIIKDMAQFPLSNPLGTQFESGENGNEATARIPGVMTFGVVPTMHITGYNSAVNIAARNLYAFVTHANSRNASYEATDLMIYVMGVTNLFAIWSHCVRAYGIAKSYSVMNRYMPETLLQAMGFDPDELLNNLNDFRGSLNLLASKASTLVIPSAFAYTNECFEMYTKVFADAPNSRAQLYAYVPAGYYKYNEAKYDTGGCLEYNALAASVRSLNDWIVIMSGMLDNLLLSQSVNIMAADIIKAFGDQLYGLFPINEDYMVEPVYDDEELETIMNISIAPGAPTGTYGWDIFQFVGSDPNSAPSLACYVNVATMSADLATLANHKTPLNTAYESLTPAQVVNRTKFRPRIYPNGEGATISARTHFVRYCIIKTAPKGYSNNQISLHEEMSENSSAALAVLSNFHHAPMITLEGTDNIEYVHGDVENITFISAADLTRLNDVVTQVLFNVATVYPIK